MREQIQFLEPPPREVWEAMTAWLRHHGVPLGRVPMLWFDRCEDTRRISHAEVLLGVDPATSGDVRETMVRCAVARTVQLEAVPAPFPPELRLHRARFNYTCVRPELATALTVPPTWPATPRALDLLCGPG